MIASYESLCLVNQEHDFEKLEGFFDDSINSSKKGRKNEKNYTFKTNNGQKKKEVTHGAINLIRQKDQSNCFVKSYYSFSNIRTEWMWHIILHTTSNCPSNDLRLQNSVENFNAHAGTLFAACVKYLTIAPANFLFILFVYPQVVLRV